MAPSIVSSWVVRCGKFFLAASKRNSRRYHNAGGNVGFAYSLDAIENLAARMSDEVRHGLGVEQKSHPFEINRLSRTAADLSFG